MPQLQFTGEFPLLNDTGYTLKVVTSFEPNGFNVATGQSAHCGVEDKTGFLQSLTMSGVVYKPYEDVDWTKKEGTLSARVMIDGSNLMVTGIDGVTKVAWYPAK